MLPSAQPESPPPTPPLEPFPAYFKDAQAAQWACSHVKYDEWKELKRRAAALSPTTSDEEQRTLAELASDLHACAFVGEGAPPVEELEDALERAERQGAFDAFIAAAVFRRTKAIPVDDLPRLLARVERHARFAIALRRAEALTGPTEFMPWMSKGRPGSNECHPVVNRRFVETAISAYESGDAGTWDREVLLRVAVVQGDGLVLLRRGSGARPPSGVFALRRLDVLRAGAADAILEHATLGRITIPAGRSMGPWNVAEFLAPAARLRLQASVRAAGEGRAFKSLEEVLPAASSYISEELAARPNSRGAPALRLLLTLFLE